MDSNNPFEHQVGIYGYFLDFLGIGGSIKNFPEDFIVQEIIPNGKALLSGKEIGDDVGGMYVHFVLWKRGIDTNTAINKIANICHYSEKDFGYAGLKDAQAETYQRISVWAGSKDCLGNINFPNLKIINPIKQKFGVFIGDLIGNRFQVIIRSIQRKVSQSELGEFCSDAESHGFLNYYGLQRFGSKRPIMHKIGRFLLQERYSRAIDSYLGDESESEHERISELRQKYKDNEPLIGIFNEYPRTYTFERRMLSGLMKGHSTKKIVQSFPPYFLRLAVSAYQSFVFNKLLSHLQNQSYKLDPELKLPVIGYSTSLEKTPLEIKSFIQGCLSMDELETASFNQKIKSLNSKGTERFAIVRPADVKLFSDCTVGDNMQVHFSLPKGSYGTIFLREVMKTSSLSDNYSG